MAISSDAELFTKKVSDMTDVERRRAIERLESLRDETVYEIEDIMNEISLEMGLPKYRRRRYKLGDSPNDN
ncbi:MAG: hypothetical protein IKC87_07680 [Clostridia bacterium]|nr:hypothetical protein [Clostridia bacterium]